MSQTYEFELAMTCEGCAKQARKVLGKLDDSVSNVEIDVNQKIVKVTSTLPADRILEQLKKTGKECKLKQ